MSNTWVPVMKPPHPSTIPVISELAQRIISALTLEAVREEEEMTRLYGKPRCDKKKIEADRSIIKESVNVFNNESENNAREYRENGMKENDIVALFNNAGSFSSSFETLTPDLFENDDISIIKNTNNTENIFNNKEDVPVSFVYREKTNKKFESTSRFTGTFVPPSLESLTPDLFENDDIIRPSNVNKSNADNIISKKEDGPASFILCENPNKKFESTSRFSGTVVPFSVESLTPDLFKNNDIVLPINKNKNNAENVVSNKADGPASFIFRKKANKKLESTSVFSGSFISSPLESSTPISLENDYPNINKNKNHTKNNLNNKADGLRPLIFRKNTSKKFERIPRKNSTTEKKHQTTLDRYFKIVKKPDLNIREKEKFSNIENNIISEARESVNWEASDKRKTEGNYNEKYSNLSKPFIFAQPETAIRKRHLDANEVCGTGTMQGSDNSIKKIKKYIRPLKTF